MRTIYVDVLIGLNVFINFFILLAVSKITRKKSKTSRFFWSSAAAGLFSLIIFLPELNLLLSAAIKILITAVIVLIAFGFGSMKSFFLVTSTYFGISFLYAGTMFFIWLCTSYGGIIINNSVVYLDISPAVFIISVMLAYAVISFAKKVLRFSGENKNICSISLYFKEKCETVKCLYDTGNMLTDAFCDAPVIIIDESISRKLTGYGAKELSHPELLQSVSVRVIPCSTVSGFGLLYGYKIDRVEILSDGKKYTAENLIAAVSSQKLKEGCKAIVGEDFLNECREEAYAVVSAE